MPDSSELQNMMGRTAIDSEGAKIGKIGQIYLDDESGQPVWVTVSTGLFGTKESFAPVYGSTTDGDNLKLAVTKDLVKDAPSVEADGHLEDSENDALYHYYEGHLGSTTGHTDANYGAAETNQVGVADASINTGRQTETDGAVGHDTSGPNTDDAMTRSEERLHVGTEQVEGGRARLRKYVVTQDVSQTVPLRHEEVRVEREPITDANRGDAMSGGDITEEEHEVILKAERPVVSKETVPVERVRLATETVTEQHEVNETVREERIDTPETVEGTDRNS